MRAPGPDERAEVAAPPGPPADEAGSDLSPAGGGAVLEPVLNSVADARALVSAVCRRGRTRGDIADDAALVASELVTNAVLHARTPVEVAVRAGVAVVRVEVTDATARTIVPPEPHASPTGPIDVFDEFGDLDPDDPVAALPTTGRGLELVAALSQRWGVDERDDGKTVWAEVGAEGGVTVDAPVTTQAGPERVPADSVQVRLVALPVRLVQASDRQFDDAMRELQVLAMADGAPAPLRALAARANDLRDQLRPSQLSHAPAVRAARERGDRLADVVADVPPGLAGQLSDLDRLLAEMHRARATGELLAVGPSPEVVAFRRWFYEEVVRQVAGRQSRPCPFPVVAPSGRPATGPLSQRRHDLLARIEAGLAAAPDLAALAAATVRRISTDLGAAFVNLLLVEADGAHVASVDRVGYRPDEPHGRRYPVTHDNPISETVRTAVPIVLRTPEERRVRYPALVPSEPIAANPTGVWVPIGQQPPAAGAIVVGFQRARDFTSGDLDLLVQVATAVHRRMQVVDPPT